MNGKRVINKKNKGDGEYCWRSGWRWDIFCRLAGRYGSKSKNVVRSYLRDAFASKLYTGLIVILNTSYLRIMGLEKVQWVRRDYWA